MIPELYKDYGTVCYSICVSLNKKNNSTISQIHKSIPNSDIQLIYHGVSILLQRNIVTYYRLGTRFYYKFISNRRVFFNTYLSFIKSVYDSNNYKHFFTVLLSGTYKLINTDMDIYKDDYIITVPLTKNTKKYKSNLYTVNFEKLDKSLLERYMMNYVQVRYSKSMYEIFKSVCKCGIINQQNVLNNLESNLILIKEDISYINDVSNIEEYLKYLVNKGIVKKDIESDRYVLGNIKDLLKLNEICRLLKEDIRLINLFNSLGSMKDSDICKNSLMKDIKTRMYRLMKYKIVYTENTDTWKYNNKWNIKLMKHIEIEIQNIMSKINKMYSEGSVVDNEEFMVYVCQYAYLGYLYFLFN
ncbi:hypothetical protein P3W45_000507 [Vairimorpha bombi]|jgi:hypothetical protein